MAITCQSEAATGEKIRIGSFVPFTQPNPQKRQHHAPATTVQARKP